ncbi:MAG TPA: hypothetical protein VKJ65_11330, partial [Phycisphaerae bacterium]|nr:hypothetical protein [Phycisphaerae bacterium]
MVQHRNIPDVLRAMAESSVIARISAQLTEDRHVRATGQWGSCALVIAALVQAQLGRPMLILTAHLDEADDAVDQLEFFRPGAAVPLFPAFEVLPGESNISPELSAERLTLLSNLNAGQVPDFIVAPVQAVMQPCPDKDLLAEQLITLSIGRQLDREPLIDWLARHGYTRLEAVENPGDFAVRGEILDIWLAGSEKPVRIGFADQQIEILHGFDPETLGPTGDIPSLNVTAMEKNTDWPREKSVSLLS